MQGCEFVDGKTNLIAYIFKAVYNLHNVLIFQRRIGFKKTIGAEIFLTIKRFMRLSNEL